MRARNPAVLRAASRCRRRPSRWRRWGLAGAATALLLVPPLEAAAPPARSPRPAPRPRLDPRLWAPPLTTPLSEAPQSLHPAAAAAWRAFERAAGGTWTAFVDRRTGRLEYAEGSGLPWLPGRGNRLTGADLGQVPRGDAETLALLEARARELLAALGPALGVDPRHLVLSRERSRRAGDHLWLLELDLVLDGLAVEGASVVFRIAHGNLIQLGAAGLPAPGSPTPPFLLTRREAFAVVTAAEGGFASDAIFLDSGTRRLLPAQSSIAAPGGAAARELVAAWELLFVHPGRPETWRARVDATSGELLELYDANLYGQASGGVYPESHAVDAETPMPLPFVDLSTGGHADAAGAFAHAGGALSSTLTGKHVAISDTCGPIELDADRKGNLSFGTSAGTDCATPASGGAGNTHAARSLYYHVDQMQQTARGWGIATGWLDLRVPVNSNLQMTCNAFWNGFSLNFFRSGDGCGNTGEIADVARHEFGHALDTHDGSGAGERGSGEAYGDVTAFLYARDSCIGEGFFLDGNCDGHGDACLDCTGVRDVDWVRHASAAPHTVANLVQPLCPRHDFYVGACGAHALSLGDRSKQTQAHCESRVASEALWDLAARDLPQPGSPAAWAVLERLWYRSRATGSRAFVCDVSTPVWTSHGCVVDSWWRAMRAVDDDDGDLSNGTPHSCHLFAAFDRHGIACPSDPAADVCFSACAPPASPALGAVADDRLVELSWDSVDPEAVYDVYRSAAGCEKGWVKVAEDVAGGSFADRAVANDFTYSYRVIAHPAGNESCSSAPSSCVAARPIPCITPGVPAGLAARTAGDHAVELTLAGGAPAAARFNVYRTLGGCGAPPEVDPVAIGVGGPTHLDTGLSGTLTYAYRATATDETGVCESAPSSCVEVVATGACTAPPRFAGLAAATNAELAQCGVDLSWEPATALCGGPTTYEVHRSATPGFAPTPATRIAEGLTATTFSDRDGVGDRQVLEYLVLARDASNGMPDDNRARRQATATGPTHLLTLAESFDSPGGFDLPGWEHANTVRNVERALDWALVESRDGGSGWLADEDVAPSGKVLVSPPFGIGPATRVAFRHRFALQESLPGMCEDGGALELSTDGGASWSALPSSSFLAGPYLGIVDPTDGNPLADRWAWCGTTASYVDALVDLAPFAGAEGARLRWHEGDDRLDAAAEPNGWLVDAVSILDSRRTTACTTVTNRLLRDGFESGDLAVWPARSP